MEPPDERATIDESRLLVPDGAGALYEAYVFGALQRLFSQATVRHNVRLPGLKSGRPRQIDILLEHSLGEFIVRIAFDCKCYNRKVTVNHVDSFLGMMDDIRVSKGVLVTTKGYTKTAWERAQRDPRDIDLHILSPERLSEFQGIGDAFLWKGRMMAIVSQRGMARRQRAH